MAFEGKTIYTGVEDGNKIVARVLKDCSHHYCFNEKDDKTCAHWAPHMPDNWCYACLARLALEPYARAHKLRPEEYGRPYYIIPPKFQWVEGAGLKR